MQWQGLVGSVKRVPVNHVAVRNSDKSLEILKVQFPGVFNLERNEKPAVRVSMCKKQRY